MYFFFGINLLKKHGEILRVSEKKCRRYFLVNTWEHTWRNLSMNSCRYLWKKILPESLEVVIQESLENSCRIFWISGEISGNISSKIVNRIVRVILEQIFGELVRISKDLWFLPEIQSRSEFMKEFLNYPLILLWNLLRKPAQTLRPLETPTKPFSNSHKL